MEVSYLAELFGIEGQVIVITGGGGILCGTAARGLARLGARLALLDIRPEAAQAVADEIMAAGGEAVAYQADVLSKQSLEDCAQETVQHYGRIDALINGAGGNKPEATTTPELCFFDLPEAAFQAVFDLNFLGTLLPSQVFGRQMVAQGEGIILNVSSINAIRSLTKIPAYSAAKAAVKNFTEWLAVHVSQEHSPRIRVNAIAPGFYLTNQNRFLLLDAQTGVATPRGQTILDHTPMRRYGAPEELLSTLVWLLSPGAAFVHGATVVVDGGFCAFSGV
jgi:NAD(P)-dependent dehydrogenase (short-subunit alcohol dehydrogenase family)